MRFCLCLAIFSLLFTGCAMEKKPDKKEKGRTVEESVPENLGDHNAPTEVRALQAAKKIQRDAKDQQKENSKILDQVDH
jgi:hypothetical protein